MGCNCNKKPKIQQPSASTTPNFNVVDAISATLTGTAEYASEESQNIRKNICSTCEYFRSKINQCSQCGCIIFFKVKYIQSKCPVDKW